MDGKDQLSGAGGGAPLTTTEAASMGAAGGGGAAASMGAAGGGGAAGGDPLQKAVDYVLRLLSKMSKGRKLRAVGNNTKNTLLQLFRELLEKEPQAPPPLMGDRPLTQGEMAAWLEAQQDAMRDPWEEKDLFENGQTHTPTGTVAYVEELAQERTPEAIWAALVAAYHLLSQVADPQGLGEKLRTGACVTARCEVDGAVTALLCYYCRVLPSPGEDEEVVEPEGERDADEEAELFEKACNAAKQRAALLLLRDIVEEAEGMQEAGVEDFVRELGCIVESLRTQSEDGGEEAAASTGAAGGGGAVSMGAAGGGEEAVSMGAAGGGEEAVSTGAAGGGAAGSSPLQDAECVESLGQSCVLTPLDMLRQAAEWAGSLDRKELFEARQQAAHDMCNHLLSKEEPFCTEWDGLWWLIVDYDDPDPFMLESEMAEAGPHFYSRLMRAAELLYNATHH